MENKRKFLEDFFNVADGRCYFKLIDGTVCEGYIIEVNQDTIDFRDSGPWASDEAVMLSVDHIDTSSFAYYDANRKCLVDFREVTQ